MKVLAHDTETDQYRTFDRKEFDNVRSFEGWEFVSLLTTIAIATRKELA